MACSWPMQAQLQQVNNQKVERDQTGDQFVAAGEGGEPMLAALVLPAVPGVSNPTAPTGLGAPAGIVAIRRAAEKRRRTRGATCGLLVGFASGFSTR